MRSFACLLGFVFALALVQPTSAQLREDARVLASQDAPKLYDAGSAFSLNKLFSREHFRMGHAYELSAGSMGGNGYSMGVYTNSLMWQFNQKLAARVDLSVAHSPFGNAPGNMYGQNVTGEGQPFRFFVQNAEVAYRPTENTELHFSFRQSPYGSYYSPYGANPYGYSPYGRGYSARFANSSDGLFWRDAR